MDVRFCKKQEPLPRGTIARSEFCIMRLARPPVRARRIVFFLDNDLSWRSATRTKRTSRMGPHKSASVRWLAIILRLSNAMTRAQLISGRYSCQPYVNRFYALSI